jgi:carboxypeptidase PM20D1
MLCKFFQQARSMKQLILSSIAIAAVFSGAAAAQTAAHEVRAREIYARVISFRTAAGQKQMPAMVSYLVEVLKGSGVPDWDISVLDVEGETALIVRLPGRKQERPILFSAHMDVVDARPEEWERDPFTLVEEKGDFYGRGTSDNKAGVTALIATVLRFKAEKMQPSRDLVFAFVGDERQT